VITLKKPNIVRDIFTGHKRMQAVLEHLRKAAGRLVLLREWRRRVPVAPLPEENSAERSQTGNGARVVSGASCAISASLDPST